MILWDLCAGMAAPVLMALYQSKSRGGGRFSFVGDLDSDPSVEVEPINAMWVDGSDRDVLQ